MTEIHIIVKDSAGKIEITGARRKKEHAERWVKSLNESLIKLKAPERFRVETVGVF